MTFKINTAPMDEQRKIEMRQLRIKLQDSELEGAISILQGLQNDPQTRFDVCRVKLPARPRNLIATFARYPWLYSEQTLEVLKLLEVEGQNIFDTAGSYFTKTKSCFEHVLIEAIEEGINPIIFDFLCSKVSTFNHLYDHYSLFSYSLCMHDQLYSEIMIKHGADLHFKDLYGFSGFQYLNGEHLDDGLVRPVSMPRSFSKEIRALLLARELQSCPAEIKRKIRL